MDLTLNSAIGIAGQTLAALYAAIPVKIVLLLLSLLFCFAGYRLLRAVSALNGVALGVALGICVTSLFSASMNDALGMILTVLAMVVLGIVLGIVFFCWYPLGVFTACACVGAAVVYLPGLFIAQHAQAVFWLLLAGGAILFGVTGVLFLRPAGILATGLFGFSAAFVLTDMLFGRQGLSTLVIGLVLTIAGCAVQALTNRSADALPLGEGNRRRTVAAEKKLSGDAHLREPAPEEDEVSDDTHELDLSELPQEEPDEIDSISKTVAAHIGLTRLLAPEQARGTEPLCPETEQLREPSDSDAPETAEDNTLVLSLADVLGKQEDVPLEQQAQFAWMNEQPVEESAAEEEPEGEVLQGGAWNDIFRPEGEAAEAEPDTGLPEAVEEPAAASEMQEVQMPEQEQGTEPLYPETAQQTEPLYPETAQQTEPLYPETTQETEQMCEPSDPDAPETAEDVTMAFSIEEVLGKQEDVPLEQQAQFAWMNEQPVEEPAGEEEPEGEVPQGGAWNDIFRPEGEAAEAEPDADLSQAVEEELTLQADTVEPDGCTEDEEQILGNTADLMYALDQVLSKLNEPEPEEPDEAEPDDDALCEKLSPPIVKEESPEEPVRTEPEASEADVEPEEAEPDDDALCEKLSPPIVKEESPEEPVRTEPEASEAVIEPEEQDDADLDDDAIWEQLFPPIIREEFREEPASTEPEAAEAAAEPEEQDDVKPDENAVWEQLFPPIIKAELPEEPADTGEQPEEQPEAAAEADEEPAESTGPAESPDDVKLAEEADGEQADESDETPDEAFSAGALWPVLLTIVVLVLAGFGIRYVEIALALCLVCYVLRYYRTAAFACAVLCVRRVLDVVLLVMQSGSWLEIALDVLSAAAFLALTYAAMRAYIVHRHADEDKEEE
ncbi:TM7S3/TM198-like domain-containing protein [Butyricicoccus sp.]|uniref:TM7S3/TM198-like domain-containing protein n=1 Tax=Butyricicoccus sp. TaxID=2049021 RepID=UPI003F15C439